jgi:hypothetical protein
VTLSTSSPRAKQRWFALGFAVIVAMLMVGGAVLGLTSGILSTAQMGGFGIDGNMQLNTGETYDWKNAGGDPAGPNACSALAYPGFANVGGPLSLSCANDKPTGQSDNSLNGHEQDATVQSVCGSVPNNKSDLTNFYVASQSVFGGSSGYTTPQSFVYLGWTRVNTLGSADMDFEFNQADQDENLSATTCASGNGTTISVEPNRTDGDLLVQYLFGGNSISIQLSTWITDNSTQGACATQTSAPCWGAPTDLTTAGTANGSINDASTPNSFSCATPNNKTTTGCIVNELSGGNLLPDTFGEAAINLTAALSGSGCETFGSVYLKSRSSAVFTDALKDFIAPIPVSITNCVTPTLTTVLSPATATIGTSVTDTATLSGFLGSNPPGGTITFNVYTTSDCTGTPTVIAGSALAASGSNATSSATITDGNDLSPGDYQVQAVYSGDGGSNLSSSSACGSEPLHIDKAQPTLSTQDSPTTNITVGTATSISDTATFGGLISGVAPSGSVNFTLYVGTTCTTAVSGVTGSGAIVGSGPYTATYSTTWTPTTTGTYTWGISYAGDSNYKPIPTSGTGVQCGGTGETFTVVARAPGLATVQRVVPQDKVTFSGANASAGDIKGSVIFRLYQDVGGAGTCGSTGGAKYTQTITGVNSSTTLVYATTNSGDPATSPSGFSITAPTGGSFKWTVEFVSSGNNNYSSVAESSCSSEPTTVSF